MEKEGGKGLGLEIYARVTTDRDKKKQGLPTGTGGPML